MWTTLRSSPAVEDQPLQLFPLIVHSPGHFDGETSRSSGIKVQNVNRAERETPNVRHGRLL